MTKFPVSLLDRPIAHRGLHNIQEGRPENSHAAIEAAIAYGYGIEIDVQLSSDGLPMVFHDYHLDRLTDQKGAIAQHDAERLSRLTLRGGSDTISTLNETLAQISGKVPLLIEIKDQDGGLSNNVGPLEIKVSQALKNYSGDVAVMSFNPNSIAAFAKNSTDIPVGLVTDRFKAKDWPSIKQSVRSNLRNMTDLERVGACFISHNQKHLQDLKSSVLEKIDIPILCWTIQSLEAEQKARKIADNITFEGYLA